MSFDLAMKTLFIGIFIYLLYLFIFGILHGGVGMLVWSVFAFIMALIIGAFIN